MPPDALVIVLAGGMDADATSAEDASRLSEHTLRRVVTAARIASQVPSARFVLSGGGGSTVREADLMRRLMIDLGVDRDLRKAGLPACPIPTDWRQPPLDPATAWIPGTSTLLASYFASREVIALGAYLATGRL